MPSIRCQPSGRIIQARAGDELLAAARGAGVEIDSPCGGKGTCGKCIVRVSSGEVNSDSLGLLSGEAVAEGYVLACRTRVLDSDLTIENPEQSAAEVGKFADADETHLVRRELLPRDADFDPLAIKWLVRVDPPKLEGGLSDVDRLTRAIQRDWGRARYQHPLPTLRTVADAVRARDGEVTVTLIRDGEDVHVVRVEPGDTTTRHFGLAIDVGTTTIAVQLINLTSGKILITRTDYNAQIACGVDVISRINYARKPAGLEELRTRALNVINRLIHDVCRIAGVDAHEVCNAVISANTTMTHLLLGLNPEHIRLEPYTPTVLEVPYLTASAVGIDINPDSWIYLSPAVGSYVGGDITAGLLCTELAADTAEMGLFVDIGTNGELVVGNNEFLLTCACSAGSAFEGGGLECGMRGALGAIERVEVDAETGHPRFSTIGNVKPRGICGSGIIDLLANLFTTGWIDPSGKFDRTRPCERILIDGRRARYVIATAEQSHTGRPITLSELDIENVLRAKAAIYSASTLLVNQLGITFDDLAHVYIAGGFGRFLELEKAITIGLVPDIDRSKFHYIGNASLTGSYMVAVSQRFRERQIELARRLTYIELNTDPTYMDQYTGALFLPHTDASRFPSVRRPPQRSAQPIPPPKCECGAHAANHQHEAHEKVIRRGAEALAKIDLPARCVRLGLPPPNGDGRLHIRAFGRELCFELPTFDAIDLRTQQPAELVDRLLVVKYLQSEAPITPTGQLISFRELPGGQFYWDPFRRRSILPLLRNIGNDIDRLRRNLGRFQWRPVDMGDVGACISVVGNVDAYLVYRLGDEEMEPTADLLFDACAKRVYDAEEASAIAARICLGLI
jgi:uncharacterized 2Fe-2S/4Fe-4S cluster protein (DUF4445 family)